MARYTHTRIHTTQIIAMENNGVRAKGSYADIESTDGDLIQEWNTLIANEEARDELIRFDEGCTGDGGGEKGEGGLSIVFSRSSGKTLITHFSSCVFCFQPRKDSS